MSKADAEVIKMLLWTILSMLCTNPYTEAVATVCVGFHAITAIIAVFAKVD